MTIAQAIAQLDSLKHNTFSQEQKVAWLGRVEAMIKKHIIDTHVGGDKVIFEGYGPDVDLQTELMAPEPFDEMYLRYLEAQVDYHNMEYDGYNQAISLFKAAYNGFERWYNRTHMPLGGKMKYF